MKKKTRLRIVSSLENYKKTVEAVKEKHESGPGPARYSGYYDGVLDAIAIALVVVKETE